MVEMRWQKLVDIRFELAKMGIMGWTGILKNYFIFEAGIKAGVKDILKMKNLMLSFD